MVMLTYTLDEMNEVLKKNFSIERYEEIAFRYGLDLEAGESALNFEITSDRIDIASKYALADVFAESFGTKLKKYRYLGAKKADISIAKTHRPFVNLLHIKLAGKVGQDLQEIVKMQERLDKNVGRGRKKAAIGFFDYNKITFPIVDREESREKVKFTPLEVSSEKTYNEIINEVKQAQEYSELIGNKPVIWIENGGKIFAMPPIINSDSHSITENTKEILVDVTGTDANTVNSVTKILIHNLQFLGEVQILIPKKVDKSISTGLSLTAHKFTINCENVKSLLGIDVSMDKIKGTLSAMDYAVSGKGKDLIVTPPFYRQDIMHQVDIIDDLMRGIGVENITGIYPHSYTDGGFLENHYAIENIKEAMTGFGYQEIDINALTNEKYQFENSFIAGRDYVSLLRLKSGEVTMVIKNVFPELLRLISNNLHKKFPQNLFSVADVVETGKSDVGFVNAKRLSIVSCSKEVNVTDILSIAKKVILDSVDKGEIHAESSSVFPKTFMPGREYSIYCGNEKVGFAGELHPRVLNAFGIELPIALAEIYLDKFQL